MVVVTLDDVAKALKNTLGKRGISEENTKKLAVYLMNFFGYENEVIDNRLGSEDRDIFYMLEEEGILTTHEEEVQLKKGKMWRIHYWVLKKDQILRLAKIEEEKKVSEKEDYSVYSEISEDIWTRD